MSPEPVDRGGRALVCRHCGGTRFDRHAVRLNAILDWSDVADDTPSAGEIVACAACGLAELFVDAAAGPMQECAACGSEFALDRTRCPICGSAGTDAAEDVPRRGPVPDDACLACGTRIPLDGDTCPACGWSYATEPATAQPDFETEADDPVGDVETGEFDLPQPDREAEPAETAQGAAVPPPVPRCAHCGSPRRSGSSICGSCGRIFD